MLFVEILSYVKDIGNRKHAIAQFFLWCHSIRDDFYIYKWSLSDCEQITKELELKKVCLSSEDAALLQRFQDFQKEYGDKLGLSRAF